MDISHLYHDANFGGPTISLDVKEQIKTREVNAREDRNLQRQSETFEKAKDILEKNTTWERWRVGQTLHTIWERTPRLEKSLAMERARVEALEVAILATTFNSEDGLESETCREIPSQSTTNATPPRAGHAKIKLNRQRNRTKRKQRKVKDENEIALNTNVGILERHLQKQADFMRRSEHVVKALAKLDWRKESRRRDHAKFKEELQEFSKPVIDKARVILKGRSDVDVKGMFHELDSYFSAQALKEAPRPGKTRIPKDNQGQKFDLSSRGLQRGALNKANLLRLEHHDSSSSSSGDIRTFLPSISSTSDADPVLDRSLGVKNIPRTNDLESDVIEPNATEHVTLPELTAAAVKMDADNATYTTHHQGQATEDTKDLAERQSMSKLLPSLSDNNRWRSEDDQEEEEKDKKEMDDRNGGTYGNLRPSGLNIRRDCVTSSVGGQITGGLGHTGLHNRSQSSMASKGFFSPDSSISQVLLEEDEEVVDDERRNPFQRAHNEFRRDSRSGNADGQQTAHTQRQTFYALTKAVGLPQLWKQPQRQQKEKPAVTVSASAIARKHRRRRESRRM